MHLAHRRTLLLALASLLLPWRPAVSQTQQPSTLTANARLVVLDVVVTDKSGQPVDNLAAGDFQVFEDGKQQRIRSVEPPSAHTLPASSQSSSTTVFDPAAPASFGQSPATILVLDQLNTHFADSSFARRALHEYLAGQPALLPQPATLLSLYDGHFKPLQPFTRDREALERAIDSAPPQYAWELESKGKTEHGPIERLDQSLHALEEMAASYARIPGRKNLIWVGGGFPSLDPATVDRHDLAEVQQTIQHVTNVLLDTRVTVFAVDPTSSAAGMTEITDATQQEFVLSAGDGLSTTMDPFSSSEDFDRLGPVTGGRVIRGRNDVAQQIAQAVDLGANFYTISYTPSSSIATAAKFRQIQVVCDRPGLTATTREGYYAGKPEPRDTLADATYDLTTAAESPVPLNGLHVVAAPDSAGGAPAGSYLVRVEVPNLTWKSNPDGSASAQVYVLAVALDAHNKMLTHTLRGMVANARPGANTADPTKTTSFAITPEPARKATKLRFVVRDSASGRMGSYDLPLGASAGR
jgi:VWFA-related protein